jgi:hypothetical protein
MLFTLRCSAKSGEVCSLAPARLNFLMATFGRVRRRPGSNQAERIGRRYTRSMGWGWLAWWGFWAVVAFPWLSLDSSPHWQRVEWVPFHFTRPRDWLLNIVFFVAFGFLGTCARWRWRHDLTAAALSSLFTEIVQTFATARFPSTTDAVTNVAGAALGISVAKYLEASHSRPKT